MSEVACWVLAKNEAENIVQTVTAARALAIPVTVLDSGSNDGTPTLAREAGANVEPYTYTSHADAYNTVTARLAQSTHAMVLDADMRVSGELFSQALSLSKAGADVVRAPIAMWWAGRPLRHGSLCPPKAFFFRAGRAYFEPLGHGERIVGSVSIATTSERLVHDDRKSFDAYLQTQVRYARKLRERASEGRLNWRDRLRMRSVLGVMAAPWASYVWRTGFRSGRVGLLYALDRLIAEAIMFREQVAARLQEPKR